MPRTETKPHVDVANFMTAEDLAAEIDDPSVKDSSLDDFASPQVAHVFTSFTPARLARLKTEVEAEVQEEYDVKELPAFTWSPVRWVKPALKDAYREHCVLWMRDAKDDMPMACLVIQKIELES